LTLYSHLPPEEHLRDTAALPPARQALADQVGAILASRSDEIDTRAILRAARASGVVPRRELHLMERTGRLPDWLLDSLGLRASHPASARYETVRAFTGQVHALAAPIVLNAEAPPFTFAARTERSSDVDVLSGEDAELVLNNRAKACFLADGYAPPLTDVENLWASSLPGARPARRLEGRTAVLFVEGSQLLSHWLFDTLPKLDALRAAGRSPADYDHFLFAATPSPFHAETLAALGISQDKVVTRAGAGPRFSCEAFDAVTAVRKGFVADPWLYDFVDRAFGAPDATPRRKLFISRQSARRRRLVGEAELLARLVARGYEIVRPEEHGLREMARLCAEATAIVSLHGAGLANAVFARPGTRILEIFGAHLSAEYWRISSQRGFVYACWQARDSHGEPFDAERVAGMGVLERKEADLSVSPAELDAMLDGFEAL
jgi:glycosyl transferase family 61